MTKDQLLDEEMVDVVDEQGTPLKAVLKRQAHIDGSLHKTVIGNIINSKGEWLLVQQAADRQDAGQYVSPVGGHVSAGETEEEALKREASEEVGYEGNDFTFGLVGKAIFERHVIGRHENHLFVNYKIYSDKVPVLNNEAVSYRTFSEQELRDELVHNPKLFGGAFHFVVDSFFPELR